MLDGAVKRGEAVRRAADERMDPVEVVLAERLRLLRLNVGEHLVDCAGV